MSARHISAAAVLATLCNGRIVRTRGAEIHILGRRQVTLAGRRGLDVSAHEGVHVICSPMGRILTVYRNRNPRRIRAQRVRRRGRR